MTSFSIEKLPFTKQAVKERAEHKRLVNWPVVYTLDDAKRVYVGETQYALNRLQQHLASPDKAGLRQVRVVLDDDFHKSVCLDLESQLVLWFDGDGQYEVINRNEGQSNPNYPHREEYRKGFREIFDELHEAGMFTRTIEEIENDDLFKLSPFKALNHDQAGAVNDIQEGLFDDLKQHVRSTIVVQGDPGTGKTILGIYLMKLLKDIEAAYPGEEIESDSLFAEFFLPGFPQLIKNLRLGLIVPQISLRTSIKKVFKRIPGLTEAMVMTPFEAAEADGEFDVLIVDEAHRLNQGGAKQAMGPLDVRFANITTKLFGSNDLSKSQLDWLKKKSKHLICLMDSGQRVYPSDLPVKDLRDLRDAARANGRFYPLTSQMRVAAGEDYVEYVRSVIEGRAPEVKTFAEYDLRFFDDFGDMYSAIRAREAEHGLARLVAGYAFEWKSKKDPTAMDIDLDGVQLHWNRTNVDWIASPTSPNEVGCIHTVQGYDLNYAGVVIGDDLRLDPKTGRMYFDRTNYYDRRGKYNNRKRGIVFTDDDLLEFVRNIYSVLLTRGMLGTYVYVVDKPLREYLRPYFTAATM